MAAGILLSAAVAYATLLSLSSHGWAATLLSNKFHFYGLIAIEVALLFGIQIFIKKITPQIAMSLFFFYAALNGITMSGLFLIYNINSIIGVFAGALAIFAGLAVLGYTTKKDISGWGSFMMIGVWGVFISSIVNMFMQSDIFSMVISAVAVIVFAGLTVYDMQSYKKIYASVQGNDEEEQRYTVLGALHMYINFIMIFTHLLNLLGARD